MRAAIYSISVKRKSKNKNQQMRVIIHILVPLSSILTHLWYDIRSFCASLNQEQDTEFNIFHYNWQIIDSWHILAQSIYQLLSSHTMQISLTCDFLLHQLVIIPGFIIFLPPKVVWPSNHYPDRHQTEDDHPDILAAELASQVHLGQLLLHNCAPPNESQGS